MSFYGFYYYGIPIARNPYAYVDIARRHGDASKRDDVAIAPVRALEPTPITPVWLCNFCALMDSFI